MKQVIRGVCLSKSNGYRTKPGGGMYKSKALTNYEKSFYLQCNQYRNKLISSPFELTIDAYFKTNANDLDGIFKIVLDILQHQVKAITNDNLCTSIIARKFVDKKEPRVEFELKEV